MTVLYTARTEVGMIVAAAVLVIVMITAVGIVW